MNVFVITVIPIETIWSDKSDKWIPSLPDELSNYAKIRKINDTRSVMKVENTTLQVVHFQELASQGGDVSYMVSRRDILWEYVLHFSLRKFLWFCMDYWRAESIAEYKKASVSERNHSYTYRISFL